MEQSLSCHSLSGVKWRIYANFKLLLFIWTASDMNKCLQGLSFKVYSSDMNKCLQVLSFKVYSTSLPKIEISESSIVHLLQANPPFYPSALATMQCNGDNRLWKAIWSLFMNTSFISGQILKLVLAKDHGETTWSSDHPWSASFCVNVYCSQFTIITIICLYNGPSRVS